MTEKLIQGDCLLELPKLEAESVDLLVTDPPYGIAFMGNDWDKAVPSIAIWRECLRVMKSGSFAFVMCSPRLDVQSQMVIRLQEAGFRVDFTPIYWTYATGFPKSTNISKAVDKKMGLKREVIGKVQPLGRENRSWQGRSDGQDFAMRGGWKKNAQFPRGRHPSPESNPKPDKSGASNPIEE